MRQLEWLYTVLLASALTLPASALASEADTDDVFEFKLPSSLTVSGSSSSADTRAASAALRLVGPKNFWLDLGFDSATEKTDTLETKTTGMTAAVGTDPLEMFAAEVGFTGYGVQNQYNVREVRARGSLAVGDFDLALEGRAATFSFVNTPNSIFSSPEVELETRSWRGEIGWYGLAPYSLRAFYEGTALDSRFNDMARPVAPLFIPETAIAAAMAWPVEEVGGTLGYSSRLWGTTAGYSQRKAYVTAERTGVTTLSADYRWTQSVTTGLRFSSSRSLDDQTLDPIQTIALDLTLLF